jgi:SMODS-associating 4TM effector domain
MNQIPVIQNQDSQLKLLRARTQTYARASALMVFQLGLTVVVPVIGAISAMFRAELKPYVAAASLMIIVVDILLLDRYQKVLTKRAAKIGEQFDCSVLEMPWDQFTVGDKVEAEDIHSAAKTYASRHNDSALRGWYPEAVGTVPLHLARIICQRTNLRYDSRLRRSFGFIIKVGSYCLVIALVVSGLIQNLSMTAWVLTLAPATPILAWAGREYYRQFDTAEVLDSLMKEAKKLWVDTLAGRCTVDHCLRTSREFQNAIYNRRANSPLVLPFLYRFKRLTLEDEMNEGAAEFIREYKNSLSQ